MQRDREREREDGSHQAIQGLKGVSCRITNPTGYVRPRRVPVGPSAQSLGGAPSVFKFKSAAAPPLALVLHDARLEIIAAAYKNNNEV